MTARSLRAASRFLALEKRPGPRDPFDDTDASLFGELVDLCDGALIAALHALDAPASPTPEDALIGREEIVRTKAALDQAIAELPAETGRTLRLHVEDDVKLTEAAAERGASYWIVYREHHDALKKLQKKLASRGVAAPGGG
jgi:DNA-directed RNA polymerase specialized sigma24 family protein